MSLAQEDPEHLPVKDSRELEEVLPQLTPMEAQSTQVFYEGSTSEARAAMHAQNVKQNGSGYSISSEQNTSEVFPDDELAQAVQSPLSHSIDSNIQWWSAKNAMTISSVLLIFFIFVLIIASYTIQKSKNIDLVFKFYGTTLIICLSVFLVVAGYDDKQIAPVMGLLGTIAGYLLGKSDKSDRD